VTRLLAERRRELLEALDRLEDKAEIGLRMAVDSPEQARERTDRITGGAHVLDARHEIHADPAGRTVLEVVLLVAARDVLACRQRLQDQADEVTGPCPPRHFLPHFLRAPVGAERRVARTRPGARRAG
jgi:hypothetical protein